MVSTYITHKLVRPLVLLVKVITCRSCLGIWAGEQVEIYTNTLLEIKSWAKLNLSSSSMGIVGLGPKSQHS